MPQTPLDPFDSAVPWALLDAALAPSAELAAAVEAEGHPFAAAPASLRVAIGPGAAGHRMRRALPATDLGAFDRLTLWHRTDRAMAGAPGDPLRLRLRLGSAAVPLDDPANLWHRYLMAEAPDAWSYAALSLADLPAAIRAAATEVEIVVAATDGTPHALSLDAMAADAPRMAADADAALVALLDGQLLLGGSPVPARVEPGPPALGPMIRLFADEATRNAFRGLTALRRGDATDDGLLLWPPAEPFDLFYRVEFSATTRAQQAAMLDFAAARLGVRGWLPVGNRALRIEQVDPVRTDGPPEVAPSLRYRVAAWSEAGAPVAARPVAEVRLAADLGTGG